MPTKQTALTFLWVVAVLPLTTHGAAFWLSPHGSTDGTATQPTDDNDIPSVAHSTTEFRSIHSLFIWADTGVPIENLSLRVATEAGSPIDFLGFQFDCESGGIDDCRPRFEYISPSLFEYHFRRDELLAGEFMPNDSLDLSAFTIGADITFDGLNISDWGDFFGARPGLRGSGPYYDATTGAARLGRIDYLLDGAVGDAKIWLQIGDAGISKDGNLTSVVFGAANDPPITQRLANSQTPEFELTIVDPNGVDGDFDNNNDFDCKDVDSLLLEIAAGTNNALFDLTGDGSVTVADRDAWLANAGAAELASGNSYPVGDISLDGRVDSTDLGQLLNNFGADDAIGFSRYIQGGIGYCSGDLNADSTVDSTDLGQLLNNFNSDANAVVAVPEPISLEMAALAAIALVAFRRRRIISRSSESRFRGSR